MTTAYVFKSYGDRLEKNESVKTTCLKLLNAGMVLNNVMSTHMQKEQRSQKKIQIYTRRRAS